MIILTKVNSMDTIVLGERLRKIRKRLGLRQHEIAEAANVTQPAISRLENGEDIFSSALIKVLKFYESLISLNYLFSDDFDAESDKLFYYIREGSLNNLQGEISKAYESLGDLQKSIRDYVTNYSVTK